MVGPRAGLAPLGQPHHQDGGDRQHRDRRADEVEQPPRGRVVRGDLPSPGDQGCGREHRRRHRHRYPDVPSQAIPEARSEAASASAVSGPPRAPRTATWRVPVPVSIVSAHAVVTVAPRRSSSARWAKSSASSPLWRPGSTSSRCPPTTKSRSAVASRGWGARPFWRVVRLLGQLERVAGEHDGARSFPPIQPPGELGRDGLAVLVGDGPQAQASGDEHLLTAAQVDLGRLRRRHRVGDGRHPPTTIRNIATTARARSDTPPTDTPRCSHRSPSWWPWSGRPRAFGSSAVIRPDHK